MRWLPWIVFAVFGFYLIGNNFNAKLGMIDDHEIAMFLGSDGKVSVDEFPKEILKTEIGQWGSYLRYRPSYYTLRVLETALWRDDARLWYLSRYLMLVVSMVLGYQIMIMYFPQIVSYLFIFYIMTMPFWPDMLTRLGPSEMYALPAVLLFVYGLIKNKLWIVFKVITLRYRFEYRGFSGLVLANKRGNIIFDRESLRCLYALVFVDGNTLERDHKCPSHSGF